MKKSLAVVLGTVDAALLIVIIISLVSGWRFSFFARSGVEAGTTASTAAATEAETEDPGEAYLDEEEPEEEEKTAEAVPEETEETERTEATVQTARAAYPSAEEVSTDDVPTLADIQTFRYDKSKGAYWSTVTSDAVRLGDLSAVSGGWMAYIIDDPEHKRTKSTDEHYANINISGSEKAAKATINWFYTSIGESGKGHDDNSPDSVFKGAWSNGEFSGTGSGKLTLNSFCYENGREYATGSFTWPDGTEAVVALVRP